jgi:GT2 family glycosyltransferase
VAPANWVDVLVGILARMPRVAAVFCNVCAVDYDVSKGLVPTYVRSDDLLMSIVADNRFGHAISAGMAMRRQAILDLGGFDEALGVGGKYHSGEEFDITVRCLIAGYHVFETAQVNVVHSGFRSWDSVRASSFSTYVGIGAMYAKHVKAGKLSVLPLLCNDACRLVFRPAWERLRKGKVPQVFRAIGGMTVGFWSGMLSPIDPVRITYVLPRDRDRAAE